MGKERSSPKVFSFLWFPILVFAREEEDGWPERGTAGGAGAAPNG